MKMLVILITSAIACPAWAEYRAFLLRIEKVSNPEEFRLVTSNLDPHQYQDYYPVRDDERIFYLKTWMCRSRYHRTSGFAQICAPPESAQTESPTEPLAVPTSVENLN